jgi:hypothetical protein
LSEEYDKAVKKISEFEREMSMYRKENHQLKKKIIVLLEKC